MSSLFKINEELQRLMDMLDDPDVEVDDQAFLDTWEGLEGEFNDKVESWLMVIKHKQADVDTRKAWIKEQQAKNNSDQNAVDRMKKTLIYIMQMQKVKTAGTAVIKATVTNNSVTPLKWADGYEDDPEKIPEKYRSEKTVYSANRDEILKALDAGEKLDFVEYGERGVHLRIK